jgi:signal transduction histidine kinase
MSLGRRLLMLIATLGLGLVLIAGTAAWGVARLGRNLTASLDAYDSLRQLYGVGMELTRIDQRHRAAANGDAEARLLLLALARQVDRLDDAAARQRLLGHLVRDADVRQRINAGLNTVMGAVADTKGKIRELDDDARRQRRTTLASLAVLSVATLAAVGAMVRGQLRALDDQIRIKSAELARAERLASVGFLAAGVAHEINNPLAIISGEAELALRRASGDEPTAAALAVIRDEAFRGKAITAKLLTLARADVVELQPVSLSDVAREVVELAGRMARFKGRTIDVTVRNASPVGADRTLATQVVLNLVVNALEATDGGGRVWIEVRDAMLEVVDDGRGLAADEIARVFEPFYTSKRGRGQGDDGHGLGLSLSHTLVLRMGGTLTAHSDGPGRGCRFTLTLVEAST